MKIIDARGLSCPEPVILLRQEMASGEHAYQILVDNHASKENTATPSTRAITSRRKSRTASTPSPLPNDIHCNVLLPLRCDPLQEAL